MDIKLHDLEIITNNFSEEHKVGSGGYGDVYRVWPVIISMSDSLRLLAYYDINKWKCNRVGIRGKRLL